MLLELSQFFTPLPPSIPWGLSAPGGRRVPLWFHIAGSTPTVTSLAIGFAQWDALLLSALVKFEKKLESVLFLALHMMFLLYKSTLSANLYIH